MKRLSEITAWAVLIILAIAILTIAAHGQALPEAPHMGEFRAAWTFYGVALVSDGVMSRQWAGIGSNPCGWEGNRSFARPNGTFNTGKYFAVNGAMFVGIGTASYLLRKHVRDHWYIRVLTVAFPIVQGTHHAVNAVNWARNCA